jgi:hypothetical protein
MVFVELLFLLINVSLKERDNFGDLSIGGRIILLRILNQIPYENVARIHVAQGRLNPHILYKQGISEQLRLYEPESVNKSQTEVKQL